MSALRSRLAPGLCYTRLAIRPSPVSSPAPSPLRLASNETARTAIPHGRRNFHLSAIAGSVVDTTAQALVAVHQAGLPWYLTIPLLAVGVNFTVRLPVQYYNRVLNRKRRLLSPFISAWAQRHRMSPQSSSSMRMGFPVGPYFKSTGRMYKTWGVQRWKSMALLLPSLAPFILVTEALRQMSGAPSTWLAQFMTQRGSAVDAASAHTSALFDPSLAQGGLVWFTDLTAMDPYFTLPLLTTTILLGNILRRTPMATLRVALGMGDNSQGLSFWQRSQVAGMRTLFLMPLLPLAFLDLPSAIFLYWATAFSLQGVNHAILDKLLPLPPAKLSAPTQAPGQWPFLTGPASRT